jgi:hypothetical protein
MTATLYQSETAPNSVRGLVISLQQLSITFGILVASIINLGLEQWDQVSDGCDEDAHDDPVLHTKGMMPIHHHPS